MQIGIDIDNVIGNTFQDLAYYIAKIFGKRIDPIKLVELIRRNTLQTIFFIYKAWRMRLLVKISPITGSAETIRKWYPKHKIILITSRSILLHRQTEEWLKKHNIPYHELLHAKEGMKYKRGKECTVFIEDNQRETEILADYCKFVFLFDYPWNRKSTKKSNIIRINSWPELDNHIANLT